MTQTETNKYQEKTQLPEGLTDLGGQVVFVPVRHHSPACARLVRDILALVRPGVVLLEGPSDYNNHLDQLFLDHHFPISIYSYMRWTILPGEMEEHSARSACFYPFCDYSPEWVGLNTAHEAGCEIRFIDMPWSQLAHSQSSNDNNRYHDGELREANYWAQLCTQLGVENFDDVWDNLFEIPQPPARELFETLHLFCYLSRQSTARISDEDVLREEFMSRQIAQALSDFPDNKIVVITGGFHSSALHRHINGLPRPENEPSPTRPDPLSQNAETGISLTPYSYHRLDSLTGYGAGMPGPGFYHHVWIHREKGESHAYRTLLAKVIKDVRKQNQTASTADLIAAETTTRALAQLRGHHEPWRQDLIDGIMGALVKDDFIAETTHPMLLAVQAVFRGDAVGLLSKDSDLPPLLKNILKVTQENDLYSEYKTKTVHLNLRVEADRLKSQILHRLRVLEIDGFNFIGGPDFINRSDLMEAFENWTVCWTPYCHAACIEASIYGSTLQEASHARWVEEIAGCQHDAIELSVAMLNAALMGLPAISPAQRLVISNILSLDSRFENVSSAMEHLLYLYLYDEILNVQEDPAIAEILTEAYARSVYLLESLGSGGGNEDPVLHGLQVILEVCQRTGNILGYDSDELADVFLRIGKDKNQLHLIRGGAVGALWSLAKVNLEEVTRAMYDFNAPEQLGDFLKGLFTLSRETIQRNTALISTIDQLVMSFDEEEFSEAIPSLRLAFVQFTPREKAYMMRTLLGETDNGVQISEKFDISPERAAKVLAFEAKVFSEAVQYGIISEEKS